MAGLDDDARDDEPDPPIGPRPDPRDRPWVHPAELQAFTAAPTAPVVPPRPREWVIGVMSALAGVAATVLVLVAFGSLGGRERGAIPPPVVTAPNAVIDYAVAQRVANSAAASVVTVSRNDPAPASGLQQGSGVVLRTDRVLTSAHLVNGATEVRVTTKFGDTITAQVIGMDPSTDLCLLAVEGVGPELPEPELVEEPAIGDVVVALGAGRGNEGWTSIGVVQEVNWLASNGPTAVAGLLATGTDTTPATTGGALFDPNGRIIGILTTPPGATRSGLAVPIDVALDVTEQLERNKTAAHGAIGVVFGADRGGNRPGAMVGGVVPDGPAAKANPPLQAGDVITGAGDDAVNGWWDMVAVARRRHPTDQLEVTFDRGGRTQRTRVELMAAPDAVDSEFGPTG